MYNKKYIIAGIVIFVGLFTLPFWINFASPDYEPPKIVLPANEKECIEPAEYMLSEHMSLLNTWRDEALRDGKRLYVASNGKEWVISLQNTCMSCHANKAKFCDSCHTANSVDPYCWDCHVAPRGNE